MDSTRQLLDRTEFHTGLLVGLVALVLVIAIVLALRVAGPRTTDPRSQNHTRPLGIAGLAFAVAGVVALSNAGGARGDLRVPDELILGLALLAAAGFISALPPWPGIGRVAFGAALSLPGAWVLAEQTDLPGPSWFRPTVLVAAVVIGPLVADFDHRHTRLGAGPVLLLVAAGGLYATTPDTERVMVLLGVAVPLAFVGFPVSVAALGRGGAHAAVGMMLWTATFDAYGRPAALVGVLGVFGIMATEPLGRLLPGRPLDNLKHQGRIAALVVLTGTQIVLVLYAAQVAGSRQAVSNAVALIVPAMLGGLLVGWLLAPLGDHHTYALGTGRSAAELQTDDAWGGRDSGSSSG